MNNKRIVFLGVLLAIILIFSTFLNVGYVSASGGSSGGAGATRCWGVDQTVKLDSGKKLFLAGGDKYYGYCHIQIYHMAKVGSRTYKGKSQFSKFMGEKRTIEVAKEVIDHGKKGKVNKAGNHVREKYVKSLKQTVRVVYRNSSSKKHDYSITTMYPIK
ncbi:hypothetical protein NST20_09340 [Weizmannia sp. FSL W8-0676]|uniref:hypothetical protein n=1 Tax=Weizmannia sp. FSL W8-0676 TaxID=2954703 RepID=UPI003158C4CA